MLLERDRELGLLTGLLAGVRTGGGKVVLIRGEAGVGKTALVREFIRQSGNGAAVHVGFCDDLSTPQPLGPIWEIAGDEPALREAIEAEDRRGVFASLVELLSQQLRPTVVVIEDAQWVDEATLDAVTYAGRRISQTNGMLVLTYRDAQVDYEHPLRAVIGALAPADVVRVPLERLSVGAVAEMVGESGLEVGAVMELTEGNPLFVREVVAAGAGSVPVSVRDAVMGRVARLSPPARDVLELVAVFPGEADAGVVEAVAGPGVGEALAECARSGLVEVDDATVAFPHALGRVAVESVLGEGRRRELNAAVLTQLATDAGVDSARLAHHALEAGDVDAVLRFVPVAARRAQALGSHREASALFHSLEAYLDHLPAVERAGLLEEWAASEGYVEWDEARLLLLRAIELRRAGGDEVALARTLTAAARTSDQAGWTEEPEELMSEALALYEQMPAAPGPEHASAKSTRAWLAMRQGRSRETVDLAAEAVEFAEQVGAEEAAIDALNTQGNGLSWLGDPRGVTLVEQAYDRARQSGDSFGEWRAIHNLAAMTSRSRDMERAVPSARRALELAIQLDWPEMVTSEQAELAQILLRSGQWDEAEELLDECVAAGHWQGITIDLTKGVIDMRRGQPGARAALDRAHPPMSRSRLFGDAHWAALAEWLWLNDETDTELTTDIKEAMQGALDGEFTWDAGEIALWLRMAGRIEEAPSGIAEPYRLIIDGHPEAAAQQWAEKGCPYEQAIALSHGDTPARLQALDILDHLGATAVAAKLRQQMRDHGIAVPRGPTPATRAHRAGLTARQAEILELLAAGLSNPDIADQLFISPRTVEHHVSAILSKLDATTRDQAVTHAKEQGLLPAAV